MTVVDSIKEQLYRPVHAEETDSESSEGFPFLQSRARPKSYLRVAGPWIASTIILTIGSTYLLFQQRTEWAQCFATASSAFETDLHDAHPHVAYEERVFSGKLWFNEETQLVYRDVDPAEPQYFGPPTPEMDAAWDDLLRGISPPQELPTMSSSRSDDCRRIRSNDCRRSGTIYTDVDQKPRHKLLLL